MSGTNRSFSADIYKFEHHLKSDVGELLTRIAEETFDELQGRTLVDSGWARANWQLTVNAPAKGVYDHRTGRFVAGNTSGKGGLKPPKGAAITIPSRKKLKKLRWNDRIFFTNNIAYMIGFEASIEARTGHVKLALQNARRRIIAALKRLS